MKNRYLVFYGYCYENSGGMGDFIGAYEYLIDCLVAVEKKITENFDSDCPIAKAEYIAEKWEHNWAHILNVESGEIVWNKGADRFDISREESKLY